MLHKNEHTGMHVLSIHTQVKAETDQFLERLEVLGIVSMIKRCPDLLRPLFIAVKNQLTAGALYIPCAALVNYTDLYALLILYAL